MADENSLSTRIGELEADNRRLRSLLEQHNAAGELRHRLRNTLALLRTMVRKSAETDRDLADYVGHLDDRLDTIARAQADADALGYIDLHKLLAEELLRYGILEDESASLSGPTVRLQPRAGQIFAAAIHELAVNGVEHGMLGVSAGRLSVVWGISKTEDAEQLLLDWKESGSAEKPDPARTGYGTEVLTKTLPYELDAKVSLSFGPEGFHCKVVLPFPKSIGEIV